MRNRFTERRCGPIATIRDVAQRAGVSTTTVSHILNNTRFVSDELRNKVFQVIKELNYQPYGLARSLRTKKTNTIGMIIPDNTNPYFAEVARGIEDICFRLNYSVILCNSGSDPRREAGYLELLIEKGVDGLAFVSTGNDRSAVEILAHQDIPRIIVDREVTGVSIDAVLVDNLSGGYYATRYLLSLGHRRIACITGPSLLNPSAQRVVGYEKALKEAGLPRDEELIVAGDFHSKSGYAGTRSLLNLSRPPTAIFACNDLMAFGVLYAAHELGLEVPQQLSVVGFDDINLSSFSIPRLSTVAQPKYEIGRRAALRLVERIKNKELPPYREVLKTRLVIRDSCMAPNVRESGDAFHGGSLNDRGSEPSRGGDR